MHSKGCILFTSHPGWCPREWSKPPDLFGSVNLVDSSRDRLQGHGDRVRERRLQRAGMNIR